MMRLAPCFATEAGWPPVRGRRVARHLVRGRRRAGGLASPRRRGEGRSRPGRGGCRDRGRPRTPRRRHRGKLACARSDRAPGHAHNGLRGRAVLSVSIASISSSGAWGSTVCAADPFDRGCLAVGWVPTGVTRRARREPLILMLAGALVLLGCVDALAVKPTAAEIARSRTWLTNAAASGTASLPFSFTYGGRPSAEVLSGWTFDHTVRRLPRRRTEHTLRWRDPETGLVVRFVAVQYGRFPTLEWTLHFENTGSADTPILEAIQALDMRFERGATGEFLLHHNVGSPATSSDYAPIETPLPRGAIMRLAGLQGRPTTANLSYFNLAWEGEGVIVVVGWPGQWAAEFAREGERGVRIRAGQELTHFRLRPGEEVRTPLVVLQAWQGDWMRGQNVWRRWMTVHNLPRPGGRLPRPQLLGTSFRATVLMSQTDEADQIMEIDRYREEGLRIDAWWMDAGWYPAPDGWFETGTWEVDPVRFPRGLRPISDHAHAHHVKTLLWFEPERVSVGSWLADNRPEWVIGGRAGGILDLGNPEAWRWVVDRVAGLLTDNRIDI